MKKAIFLTIMTLLFVGISDVFALPLIQEGDGGLNLGEYVTTFAVFVSSIILATEFFRTTLKIEGITIQIISWGLGVVIAIVANLLNLGIFAEVEIWIALVLGVGGSLAANGVADTGIIQALLSLIPGVNTKEPKK